MKKCPNCGTPTLDDVNVCLSCGSPLTPAKVRACAYCGQILAGSVDYCPRCGKCLRSSLLTACPVCGHPNRREATFCENCSAPMVHAEKPRECPHCARELPAGAEFCPSCGARRDPDLEKRCPSCQRVVSPYSRYCPGCGTLLLSPPAQKTNNAEAPAPPVQKKGGSQFVWLSVIVVLLFLTILAIYFATTADEPADALLPTPIVAATTSKGAIAVGQPAYVDGRNLDSVKPATRMQVPVWDDTPGTGIACYLEHGAPVQVREIRWVDTVNQHYFRIEAGECWGWLPEVMISSAPQPAVGEKL